MAYVSCRYTTPPQIICTDDNGVEWSLTDDSQVGDYLRFVEEGGTIEPAAVPVDKNITAVPDTLFGGPTIREALSGGGEAFGRHIDWPEKKAATSGQQ